MADRPNAPGRRSLPDELASARAEVADLRAALQNSRVIGVAMGILMERHDLTADAAFGTLARMSQRSERTLADIAGELVDARLC